MAQEFIVTATLLNVRSAPAIEQGNVIGKLGEGQRISATPTSSAAWHQVSAGALQGFAASSFLRVASAAAPVTAPLPGGVLPPAVHFPASPQSALTTTLGRHSPLAGATPRPRLAGETREARIEALHEFVTRLDVARSLRYSPGAQTYCNIYAYDFCFLAGVYLPRVWWNSKALLSAVAGTPPEVIYDKTVHEMTANALHRWLGEWGDDYGWEPCPTMTNAQERANNGDVCLITAERMDPARSGHIVILMPENAAHAADRTPAGLHAPLQSQAGRVNKSYFTSRWFTDLVQFRASGFWAHA
jgi:hypothetical protein